MGMVLRLVRHEVSPVSNSGKSPRSAHGDSPRDEGRQLSLPSELLQSLPRCRPLIQYARLCNNQHRLPLCAGCDWLIPCYDGIHSAPSPRLIHWMAWSTFNQSQRSDVRHAEESSNERSSRVPSGLYPGRCGRRRYRRGAASAGTSSHAGAPEHRADTCRRTWAIPILVATDPRSKHQCSIGWPQAACASASSTTHHAAALRAHRCSQACTRTRRTWA